VLGGDYLMGGGTYHSTGAGHSDATFGISKFGGSGEFNTMSQVGDWPIGWRPILQGNMGTVNLTNHLMSGILAGDVSKTKTFAIQFGGGARLWFTDEFSVAPTIMGMYGHAKNSYTANSAFMLANLPKAKEVGLVDWSADTWTVRPSVDLEYIYTVGRTLVTFSSDPTYFHTESFKTSSTNININGDSWFVANKIDVDIPLSRMVFGHELRSGGYLERSQFYGALKDGLSTAYINEAHGRVVLDFLNELWLTQWIGLGGSYYWGANITGWSAGVDFMIVF
jgi:Solitary outer membrane autotransporter beta-barrel domain